MSDGPAACWLCHGDGYYLMTDGAGLQKRVTCHGSIHDLPAPPPLAPVPPAPRPACCPACRSNVPVYRGVVPVTPPEGEGTSWGATELCGDPWHSPAPSAARDDTAVENAALAYGLARYKEGRVSANVDNGPGTSDDLAEACRHSQAVFEAFVRVLSGEGAVKREIAGLLTPEMANLGRQVSATLPSLADDLARPAPSGAARPASEDKVTTNVVLRTLELVRGLDLSDERVRRNFYSRHLDPGILDSALRSAAATRDVNAGGSRG